MLQEKLKDKNIILGSKSPRRQNLLGGLDIEFSIQTQDVDEDFSDDLIREEIPVYLAELKASEFNLSENDILITSDTTVFLNGNIMNKPQDRNESFEMISNLSGNQHTVITGVCLSSKNKRKTFFVETEVYFNDLTKEEINYYIDKYQPFDKAGSYGIQEWIGYIGIKKIEGCFFNVMGLPLQELYKELLFF